MLKCKHAHYMFPVYHNLKFNTNALSSDVLKLYGSCTLTTTETPALVSVRVSRLGNYFYSVDILHTLIVHDVLDCNTTLHTCTCKYSLHYTNVYT